MLHYPNQDDPKGPPNVAATSAAITSALAPGPYYWNVVPVDAEGNRGVATQTSAFSWLWNSVNAATMTDLDPAPEAFDLRFSCNPIPGAARYEVEINSSVDFAPGSKVCCTAEKPTTYTDETTSFYWAVLPAVSTDGDDALPLDLPNPAKGYWRVRADDENLTGLTWSVTGTFQKKLGAPVPSAPNVVKGDCLTVVLTTAVVVVNLLSDIALATVDPRLREA